MLFRSVVAWLGRLWGLPSIVADLLDQCASPFVWDAESITPAAAVRLAQALSQARGDGHLAGDVKEFLRRRGRLDRVYGWTRAAASVPDPAAA